MSKKKMPRAAMSLKDFHGGSIPSDLPLPSAPGMTVDRTAFERPNSAPWMSPTLGRGFGGDRGGYNRQGSGNGIRTFEEKASYFPNSANIGRNYDEDERKPVDNRPRSSHSADRYEDLDRYEERRPGYDKSIDRYVHDDQGGFESRGSTSNDRFPRSQQSRPVESDNYTHEEFGLIPVGPPRLAQRETQLTSHLTSEKLQIRPQDTLASVPHQQMTFNKLSEQASGQPHASQYGLSPPTRNWRMGSQQPPAPVAVPKVSQDSAPNVWTARREGEYGRTPPSDAPSSDGLVSSSWRSQRIVESSVVVEKVTSGRWQSERRSSSEQPKEAPIRQSSYGSGYSSDGVRPQFNADTPQFQTAGHSPAEPGQVGYPSDQNRGAYNDGNRGRYIDPGRARYGESRGMVFPDSNRGDYPEADMRGYADQGPGPYPDACRDRGESRAGYHDSVGVGYPVDGGRGLYVPENVRRGFSEDRWSASAGNYAETEQVVDADRGGYVDSGRAFPEAGRIGFDSGRPMYAEPSRGGYDVVNNGADSGRGGVHPDRVPYVDRGRVGFMVGGRGAFPERGNFSDAYGPESAERGRHGYFPEPVRDNYGPNPNRGVQGSDGLRQTFVPDRERGPFVDSSRVAFNGDRERNGASFGRTRSPDVQAFGGEVARAVSHSGQVTTEAVQSVAPAARAEPVERPKLKLLPRSKPLEKPADKTIEVSAQEDTRQLMSEKRVNDAVPAEPVVSGNVVPELASATAFAIVENGDEVSRPAERPKLNLKPRTKAIDPVPGDGSGKVRNSVFGGARPRELILKERGEDDAVIIGVEPVVTPVPSSGTRSNVEQQDIARVEKQDGWAEDKQEKSRPERYEGRVVDRQGANRLSERQDGNRSDRQDNRREAADRKESPYRKEGWKDVDRQDGSRREADRFDNRDRQDSKREQERPERNIRDIDKQESWRRPADPPAPMSPSVGARSLPPATSALVDPTPGPHAPGRFVHTAPASAVELAQAFSRSASLGSAIGGAPRGSMNQRTAWSPLARSPVHGFGTYLNGGPGAYGMSPKDAPFSRLAEAPVPPAAVVQSRDVFGPPGGNYGGDRQNNGFASGKAASYGSGPIEQSRMVSFMKYDSGPANHDARDWTDGGEDHPGKRSLPIRRNYE